MKNLIAVLTLLFSPAASYAMSSSPPNNPNPGPSPSATPVPQTPDEASADVVFSKAAVIAINFVKSQPTQFPELQNVDLAAALSSASISSTDSSGAWYGHTPMPTIAVTQPSSNSILLILTYWTNLPDTLQQSLALHAVLQLAGVEGSSDFTVSQKYYNQVVTDPKFRGADLAALDRVQIFQFIDEEFAAGQPVAWSSNPDYLRVLKSSKNADGSTTLTQPQVLYQGQWYYLYVDEGYENEPSSTTAATETSVCSFFGFTSSTTMSLADGDDFTSPSLVNIIQLSSPITNAKPTITSAAQGMKVEYCGDDDTSRVECGSRAVYSINCL